MLKAVIFDLDETLLDWSGRTQTWEEHEWKHLGLVFDYINQAVHPLSSRGAFYEAVIDHVMALWQEAKKTLLAPHLGKVLVDSLVQQGVPRHLLDVEMCIRAYGYELMEGVKVYPEVPEVLASLQTQGLKLGLATNALQPMSMRDVELQAVNLLQFFEQPYRVSAADIGYLKPHARIFEELLQRMGLKAAEVAFVGDNLHADIAGAQGVGMKAILRRQEYQANGHKPVRPDAALNTLDELPAILDNLYPKWRG